MPGLRSKLRPWRLALLGCAAASLAGCSYIGCKDKGPVKYETVEASGRHDTKTACKRHAAALAIINSEKCQEKLDKAEKLLNEALVADVGYGPAHNSLGMVYYLQGKLYLAAWEFEYASKLMPDYAQPYNNLGLVYERAGKYDEAVSYYSMALSRQADDPQVLGNLVRTRLTKGEKGNDLKAMISDLALSHPDPGWRQWARDEAALGKFAGPGVDLGQDWQRPADMPEALPTPIADVEPIASETLPVPALAPDAVPLMLEFPESVAGPK